MNRAAALDLIGTRVEAWTSANGIYVGTLVEVLPRRPWRGVVKIAGILKPAQAWEVGGAVRRGKRPGDLIEVGGVNISPTTAQGLTYLQALEGERLLFGRFDASEFWVRESIASLEKLIAAERGSDSSARRSPESSEPVREMKLD